MRPYLFYCSASLCLRPQPWFTVIVDWKARRATGSEGVKGRSSPNFFFFLASVAQHLSSPKSCHGRRLLREREGFLKPPQTEHCKGDIPFYQLTRADLNQAVKVTGRRNMGTAPATVTPGGENTRGEFSMRRRRPVGRLRTAHDSRLRAGVARPPGLRAAGCVDFCPLWDSQASNRPLGILFQLLTAPRRKCTWSPSRLRASGSPGR